jgi:hypothetical protein
MTDENSTALIRRIEELLAQAVGDEGKLRRALSIAAEANRTPAGQRRNKLHRIAWMLVSRALEAGQ